MRGAAFAPVPNRGMITISIMLANIMIDQGRVCARVVPCSVVCTLRREWDRVWRRPADRPDAPRFIILPIRRDFVS
jgi:hypothetical protein